MCDDTVGTSHSSHHLQPTRRCCQPYGEYAFRVKPSKLTPPSPPRRSTAAAQNVQLFPLCTSGPPTVSRIVNHCLIRACHITTNPTRARLISRSLSFLAPPLLEGCGHPRRLPRHLKHHGPQQRQQAQVYRQEVGVLTTGQTYGQQGGCIDRRRVYRPQGMRIDRRRAYRQEAHISTGGVHINRRRTYRQEVRVLTGGARIDRRCTY